MEKLINLLRERKPNFDENHILDYMYSQGTIFIKDGKPVYAYDEDIFPNTELMIISKKEGFIKRLVENDKIDRHKFYDKNILKGFMTLTKGEKIDSIIMNLSISDTPIEDLISYLK